MYLFCQQSSQNPKKKALILLIADDYKDLHNSWQFILLRADSTNEFAAKHMFQGLFQACLRTEVTQSNCSYQRLHLTVHSAAPEFQELEEELGITALPGALLLRSKGSCSDGVTANCYRQLLPDSFHHFPPEMCEQTKKDPIKMCGSLVVSSIEACSSKSKSFLQMCNGSAGRLFYQTGVQLVKSKAKFQHHKTQSQLTDRRCAFTVQSSGFLSQKKTFRQQDTTSWEGPVKALLWRGTTQQDGSNHHHAGL